MKSRRIRHAVAAVLMGGTAALAITTPVAAQQSGGRCSPVVGTDGVAYDLDHPERVIPKCEGKLVQLNHPVKSRRGQRRDKREADRKARNAKREADRKARNSKREADRKARRSKNVSLGMEDGRYWS